MTASLLFALSVSVHVSERYISAGLFGTYNIKLNLVHTRITCCFSVAVLLQIKYSGYLFVQVTCVSSLVAWTAFWVSVITIMNWFVSVQIGASSHGLACHTIHLLMEPLSS